MDREERKARMATVLAMYAAMARPVSDRQVIAVANATARVPLPWLRAACEYIAQTWSMERNPGAAEIRCQAAREAGFHPLRGRVDYIDPDPIWWPRFPQTVVPQLAHQWGVHPARLRIPAGQVEIVSGPRQITARAEPREGAA